MNRKRNGRSENRRKGLAAVMGAPAATGCLPGSGPCRRTRRLPQNSGRKRKEKRGEKGERKRGGKELSAIAQQKTAALCSAKGAGGGFGQPAPALDWLKGGICGKESLLWRANARFI